MLFLDGVYSAGAMGTSTRFYRVNEPSNTELMQLVAGGVGAEIAAEFDALSRCVRILSKALRDS